jgi:hypothetical protein
MRTEKDTTIVEGLQGLISVTLVLVPADKKPKAVKNIEVY